MHAPSELSIQRYSGKSVNERRERWSRERERERERKREREEGERERERELTTKVVFTGRIVITTIRAGFPMSVRSSVDIVNGRTRGIITDKQVDVVVGITTRITAVSNGTAHLTG